MTRDPLISLVERYAAHVGRSEATIAKRAGSHARLFSRLRCGESCNVSTHRNVMAWFSENWPADLEWPRDIPRPPKGREEAA